MTAHTRLDPPLVESIRKALTGHALPGETHGPDPRGRARSRRVPRRRSLRGGSPAKSRSRSSRPAARPATGGCASGSSTTTCRSWSIRSPMPSPAANHHPPAASSGRLRESRRQGRASRRRAAVRDKNRRESMMYLELDRVDARDRQALAADLKRVLDDVRLAVRDWPKLQGKMREDARADQRSGRRGAARLVCQRRHDLARLSGRKALRSAVRRARHLQHSRRSDRRRRVPQRHALSRPGRRISR